MRVAAIIYGAESGILRRIVVSDSLEELAAPSAPDAGEEVIICDPSDVEWVKQNGAELPDLASCIAMVEAKRGKPSESARCIVVNDKGEIEAAVMADPAIDAIGDRKALYQHPEATSDWKLSVDSGEFEKPVASTEELPADPVADAKVR